MRGRARHRLRPTHVHGGARASKVREQAWVSICETEFGSFAEIGGIPLAEALQAEDFGPAETAEEFLAWAWQSAQNLN
jgi:hypothetical protein